MTARPVGDPALRSPAMAKHRASIRAAGARRGASASLDLLGTANEVIDWYNQNKDTINKIVQVAGPLSPAWCKAVLIIAASGTIVAGEDGCRPARTDRSSQRDACGRRGQRDRHHRDDRDHAQVTAENVSYSPNRDDTAPATTVIGT